MHRSQCRRKGWTVALDLKVEALSLEELTWECHRAALQQRGRSLSCTPLTGLVKRPYIGSKDRVDWKVGRKQGVTDFSESKKSQWRE